MNLPSKKACAFLLLSGCLLAASGFVASSIRSTTGNSGTEKSAKQEPPPAELAWKSKSDNSKGANAPDPTQEDIRPLSNQVEELALDLIGDLPQVKSKQVWVKYMQKNDKVWVLPVYVLQEAHLDKEKDEFTVCVRVLDAFNDPLCRPILLASLAQHFGEKISIQQIHTAQERVEVALVTNNNGVERTIGQALSRFRSPGRGQHILNFPVGRFNGNSKEPSLDDFDLVFRERARVLYTTDDVMASIHVGQETGMEFQNLISPGPQGEKPMLFVVAGGSSVGRTGIQQMFQGRVTAEIRARHGEPNMALITSLTDRLFDGIQAQKVVWEGQDEKAEASIVVNNVQLRATWAVFKQIRDSLLVQRAKDEGHARSGMHSSSDSNGVSHDGCFGFGPISVGGAWGRETNEQRFNSFSTADQLQTQDKEALEKVLMGTIPGTSCMRVEQFQKLVSRCQTEWKFDIGSFRRGEADFPSRQSLQPFSRAATREQEKRMTELEAEIARKAQTWWEALSTHRGAIRSINAEQGKLLAAHATAMDEQYKYGIAQGRFELIIYANKVWGHPIPKGYGGQEAEMNAHGAAAAKANGEFYQARSALEKHGAEANQAETTMAQYEKELSRLRGELAKVQQALDKLGR